MQEKFDYFDKTTRAKKNYALRKLLDNSKKKSTHKQYKEVKNKEIQMISIRYHLDIYLPLFVCVLHIIRNIIHANLVIEVPCYLGEGV